MKPKKIVKKARDLVAKARNRALSSRAGTRVAGGAVKAVTALDDLAGASVATRAVKKALDRTDLPSAQKALQKVLAPPRKMPRTIRTTGSKRLPGATAAKAVRRGSDDFKPRKGKKN